MKNRIHYIAIFCLIILLSACANNKYEVPVWAKIRPQSILEVPQEPTYYLSGLKNIRTPLLTEEEADSQYQKFHKRFFNAWSHFKPSKSDFEYFKSLLRRSPSKRGYAENLQPWSDKAWAKLSENAHYKAFPSLSENAIVVKNTAIRTMPTAKPYFTNIYKPGNSYPFDMLQNSAILLGTPVKVFHTSLDKQWYYTESSLASGWILADDIAFVDEDFAKSWKNSSRFVSIIQDEVVLPLYKSSKLASLGTILPLVLETETKYSIRVPYRTSYGMAEDITVLVDKENAVKQPLVYTQANMAALATRLMSNTYGWGGDV